MIKMNFVWTWNNARKAWVVEFASTDEQQARNFRARLWVTSLMTAEWVEQPKQPRAALAC